MPQLWEKNSLRLKRSNPIFHLLTGGPFGGSLKVTACGLDRSKHQTVTLIEHITCPRCQEKARQYWNANARYERGIEDDE